MNEQMQALVEGVECWRSRGIEDYWIRVDYIGSALNRMGNHTLTFTQGKLWHLWHDDWREIETGSDFWLFSVPGAFTWARDILTKVVSDEDVEAGAVELRFDAEYGYVEFLRVKVSKRDAANFTFEVKGFGEGVHPDFDQ
ncbi:MAG: hypothetical protein JXB30_09270 [Anaerolineae bacterium]|nr:hypothetical protein [Anaerolineae bacterium]